MQIVFLHGLESGPRGSKFQSLAAAFANVTAPDTEGVLDVDERLRCIEEALAGQQRLLLIGSSFGGLMACLFADRHPDRVAASVLLAPALHDRTAQWVSTISRVPERCVIIHGVGDSVVPIAASRVFAKQFELELVEVDDGHRLANSHDRIIASTRRLLEQCR
jgi:predicted peptidase